MRSRRGAHAVLVDEPGFSYMFIVQMPIDSGIIVVMGQVEDHLSRASVQLAGQRDDASALRVDELHRGNAGRHCLCPVLPAIFRMLLPVIPFHSGRKAENILSVNAEVVRAGLCP